MCCQYLTTTPRRENRPASSRKGTIALLEEAPILVPNILRSLPQLCYNIRAQKIVGLSKKGVSSRPNEAPSFRIRRRYNLRIGIAHSLNTRAAKRSGTHICPIGLDPVEAELTRTFRTNDRPAFGYFAEGRPDRIHFLMIDEHQVVHAFIFKGVRHHILR